MNESSAKSKKCSTIFLLGRKFFFLELFQKNRSKDN